MPNKDTADVVTEIDGTITLTEGDVRKTYYPNQSLRTLYMDLHSFEVGKSLRILSEETSNISEELQTSVWCQATLRDESISVIGAPITKTKTIPLSFKTFVAPLDRGSNPDKSILSAAIAYCQGDREMGTKDQWISECIFSKETIDALAASIVSNNLTAMVLAVEIDKIYLDRAHTFPSMTVNWYLRPSLTGNSTAFPEVARGKLTRLSLETNVGAPAIAKEASKIDEDLASASAAILPVKNVCSEEIALGIARLTSTVKTVGWAIAIGLVILFFKY